MADETKRDESTLEEKEAYLEGLLKIFKENPKSDKLGDTIKILLNQIQSTQQEVMMLTQQIDKLNNEIRERQEKGNELLQKLTLKRGESQGYVNIILKLKK